MMYALDRVFFLCIAVRFCTTMMTRTAFAPDEFWQGPEVAHRMVFGYGHLTWEWAVGLRSYAHPTLYAAFFGALKVLRLDTASLVAKGPQLVHIPLAAATDVAVYRLANIIFDDHVASWTLCCQLFSWFNAYCLTRTYSSSVEACLMTVAILLLMEDVKFSDKLTVQGGRRSLRNRSPKGIVWMVLAAFCCIIRPTGFLTWIVAVVWYLHKIKIARIRQMMKGCLIGLMVLGASILWDRIWYNRWVFVPLNFVRFNLFTGGSAMYGAHPWHWNLTNGIPVVLASYVPFLLIGLFASKLKRCRFLCMVSVAQILTYSLAAHKEFRFLLPSVQLLMPFIGYGASFFAGKCNLSWKCLVNSVDNQRSKDEPKRKKCKDTDNYKADFRRTWIIRLSLGIQLIMALYFCIIHQKGQIDVMNFLRNKARIHGHKTSILFLTPCHATPYYSYVHQPIRMRFLDCSPPGTFPYVWEINKSNLTDWLDVPQSGDKALAERSNFEDNMSYFFNGIIKENTWQDMPLFIVAYKSTSEQLREALQNTGYQLEKEFWNSFTDMDGEGSRRIAVWFLHPSKL